MSPLKRIFNRMTGQDAVDSGSQLLRAFGKLPSSREFLQLRAGQGPGKIGQDWLRNGHEEWVRRREGHRRGQIVPFSYFLDLPELSHQSLIACVWSSQDGAAPPRSFPFMLYVVCTAPPAEDWLDRFLLCEHYRPQFEELFEALFEGKTSLRDLEDFELRSPSQLEVDSNDCATAASQILLRSWLQAMLPALHCDSAENCLAMLTALAERWRAHASETGIAVRLPLSRQWPYQPQVAAWLKWLASQLKGSPHELTGLFVPLDAPQAEPAVTITTRPTCPADFHFLTSNAASYPSVDDATRCKNPSSTPTAKESPQSPSDTASLWDWATATPRNPSPKAEIQN